MASKQTKVELKVEELNNLRDRLRDIESFLLTLRLSQSYGFSIRTKVIFTPHNDQKLSYEDTELLREFLEKEKEVAEKKIRSLQNKLNKIVIQ